MAHEDLRNSRVGQVPTRANIRIRPARLIDAEGIARVHVVSWKETYRGIMPDRFLAARTVNDRTALWELALSEMNPGHVLLVAEAADGEIVGFVSGGPARDPEFGPGGEVYALYLLKRFQGLGIGRDLFAACRERLTESGLRRLLVHVLRANPARGFYFKMGGTPVGGGEVVRGGRLLAEERFVWE